MHVFFSGGEMQSLSRTTFRQYQLLEILCLIVQLRKAFDSKYLAVGFTFFPFFSEGLIFLLCLFIVECGATSTRCKNAVGGYVSAPGRYKLDI